MPKTCRRLVLAPEALMSEFYSAKAEPESFVSESYCIAIRGQKVCIDSSVLGFFFLCSWVVAAPRPSAAPFPSPSQSRSSHMSRLLISRDTLPLRRLKLIKAVKYYTKALGAALHEECLATSVFDSPACARSRSHRRVDSLAEPS